MKKGFIQKALPEATSFIKNGSGRIVDDGILKSGQEEEMASFAGAFKELLKDNKVLQHSDPVPDRVVVDDNLMSALKAEQEEKESSRSALEKLSEKDEEIKHQEELWDGLLRKRANVDNTVKKLPDSIYKNFDGDFFEIRHLPSHSININDKIEDVKNSMHDSANIIYKDLFGKGVDDRSISYNYSHNEEQFKPSNAFFNNSTFVDINVDKEMVDYMNKELKQDNLLRKLIDVNHDGDLSKDEIQDYFDKFRKYETGISVNDLTNIFAVKNNVIVQDSLFGDKEELGYRDIKGNSIITDNDFDLLDKADGKVDGIISKDTFAKFGFDKNGDGIIDQDEYKEGMNCVKEAVANISHNDADPKTPYDVDPKDVNNGSSQHQPSTPEESNVIDM